jgi:hypothetical protein
VTGRPAAGSELLASLTIAAAAGGPPAFRRSRLVS